MFLLFVIFSNFFANRLEKQGAICWGHPSKKYIQWPTSIVHFEFLSPWTTASIITENHWAFTMVHSSFLILACFSQEREVQWMYWTLFVGSQHLFPLPFIEFSNYKLENHLALAVLQIGLCMQLGFCQWNVLIQDLGGGQHVEVISPKFQQMSMMEVTALFALVFHGCEAALTVTVAPVESWWFSPTGDRSCNQ